MTTQADIQAAFRSRHPDRARLVADITTARQVAAFRVAGRHSREYEAEILRECKARGLPRFPPPLPKDQDARGGWQRTMTHCRRGHLYDDANTHIDPQGHRVCRTCRRERVRRRQNRAAA